MTSMHYAGAAVILFFITAIGLFSGLRVKSAGDFSVGARKAGGSIVAGTIVGTLVGGAATIGTAQLAFSYGLSAWWFTLGGGIACILLGVFYAKPFYLSGMETMPGMLAQEYGSATATAAAVLTSLGSFLSIVSQVLAGIVLITSVSHLSPGMAAVLIIVLMLAYVVFGGVWGAGLVGIAKTALLYFFIGACGVMVVRMGVGPLLTLPAETFFSLFARGVPVDLGAGFSLILGVLTTQAYIQAIVSASSLRCARVGIFTAAVLIPLIGIAGILVGLYMRVHFPAIAPGSALPLFVMEYMPPLFAGMSLGVLLVAVVGTGAGVALGLSAMFCSNIYRIYICPHADERKLLLVARLALVVIFAAAGLMTCGNLGSLILGWSFMSMGLRGAVAFGPLTTALFLPRRVRSSYVLGAMFVGPLCILLGNPFIGNAFDPLFLGVGVSLLVLVLGRKREGMSQTSNPLTLGE